MLMMLMIIVMVTMIIIKVVTVLVEVVVMILVMMATKMMVVVVVVMLTTTTTTIMIIMPILTTSIKGVSNIIVVHVSIMEPILSIRVSSLTILVTQIYTAAKNEPHTLNCFNGRLWNTGKDEYVIKRYVPTFPNCSYNNEVVVLCAETMG